MEGVSPHGPTHGIRLRLPAAGQEAVDRHIGRLAAMGAMGALRNGLGGKFADYVFLENLELPNRPC